MNPAHRDDANESDSTGTVYGASRVFDLFTLMAITLAFAILFASLKYLAPGLGLSAMTVTLLISGYVTLIALGQMFLFGGNQPRKASMILGPLSLVVLLSALWPTVDPIHQREILIWLGLSPLFGIGSGYLAGGTVAGVFLVADFLRGRYNNPLAQSTMDRETKFDEIE